MNHCVSLVFLVLTFIFCIIGYSGAKGDLAWSRGAAKFSYEQQVGGSTTRKFEYDVDVNYGLMKEKGTNKYTLTYLTGPQAGQTSSDNFDVNTDYNSDDCTADYCDDCERAGDTVVSFITFAIIAVIICAIFTFMRKNEVNSGENSGCKKLITFGSAVAGGIFLLVAWSTWIGGCQEKIVDYIKNEDSLNDAW
eukprot:CAMPEP_0170176466 /NCGR_PEP_ID=MMETSP0040_2-20121228/9345_1 /TAXON_ID=641309 /ORGANISM="Lotharella oceanica, Strain CCMP622" /LENGTH=192 /DNA_ID=CAMNT_0010418801 /DNA_START=134 /DNA_END=709 /DNA_ORIENTATION=+